MAGLRVSLHVVLLAAGVAALDNGLAATPAMGWSSWNYFLEGVNETLIHQVADAIVSTGLRDSGYVYVNIDAGYLTGTRDPQHNLVVNPEKFPHGIKAVGDYLHARGLKLGVYTDLGPRSCGPGPGSFGHYDQDAATFASWGADYLKVDFCGSSSVGEGLAQWQHWAMFRDALNKTGRPIYYSICPKTKAPNTGTAVPYAGGDIYSPPMNWTEEDHRSLSNAWLVEYRNNVDNFGPDEQCTDAGAPCGFITNVDAVVQMNNMSFTTPGAWTDADMLQVCNFGHLNGGMTMTEYRSHFSIWVMFASPLILSCDVRDIATKHPDCLDMIRNKEVLAVNQDPLGSAGRLVHQVGTTTANISQQVFARPLHDGGHAVLFFNRATTRENITVTWSQVGLPASHTVQVLDLWNGLKPLASATASYTASVESHGVVFVKLTAT